MKPLPLWARGWVGLLIAALLVTGCGFRLRGQIDLPPELAVVRVTAPVGHEALVSTLERGLRASGARVLSAAEAEGMQTAVLALESVDFRRRSVSVGGRGQALEYRLTYSATAELHGPDGQPLLPPQSVQVFQEYAFDERQVLGSSRQEESLREAMEGELASRLLSRIQRSLANRESDAAAP